MATATTDKVTEIRKNAAEVIRVQQKRFNGVDLVDARVYYDAGDEYKPTKKGLTLRPEVWPDVLKAIQTALSGEPASE